MHERVLAARGLVGEFSGLSAWEWRRVLGHGKFEGFMGEYLRALCLTDLWYFLRYGIYFRAWGHYDAPLYDSLLGWCGRWVGEDGARVGTKCKIIARDHCKSQIQLAEVALALAQDTNLRVLMRSYNDPKAQERLAALKRVMKSTRYQQLFPWVRPEKRSGSSQDAKWGEAQILLAREEHAIALRTPTVQALGLGTSPIGDHFEIGDYDDIEVKENTGSDTAVEAIKDGWRLDDNLFSAGSRRMLSGTPYDEHGLIMSIKEGRGEFGGYDVFVMPDVVAVFPHVFRGGDGVVLLGDRVTLRCPGAGFPTLEGNLVYCQAKVTFYSPAVHDNVEEVREVVWNDGTHFRVNRPFPVLLGQPLLWEVGREKPAAPNRCTLDDVDDLDTGPGCIPRRSLPGKERVQGPVIYRMQNRLEATDPAHLLINPDEFRMVRWEEIPEGPRYWCRSVDLAGDTKTRAATAMPTGFWARDGFYLAHLVWRPEMSPSAKILELLLGVLRVWAWGGVLDWTRFETGMIELSLQDELKLAEADPVKWLELRRGQRPYPESSRTFGDYVDEFQPGRAVTVVRRIVARDQSMTKGQRIASMQPVVQSGRFWIIEGCPHVDRVVDEAKGFRLDRSEPWDTLDALSDLIREGRKVVPVVSDRRVGGKFEEVQRRALRDLRY